MLTNKTNIPIYYIFVLLKQKEFEMKTIGLIGGMSWESSVKYFQIVNTYIKEKLGGLHSSKCVMSCVDFHEIEICQRNGEWDKAGKIINKHAIGLEKAGCDFIVLCTNTMHRVADEIMKNVNIPLIHIAKATAEKLNERNVTKVALLGTRYTMEQDFYKKMLIDSGLEVMIPNDDEKKVINDVIYDELCLGKILEKSKVKFLDIIRRLRDEGATAVILGCTEIGLLVSDEESPLPCFDTTTIHAEAAAEMSIRDILNK